jgi:glycosyltransferase involved in cell wall biosynthesis
MLLRALAALVNEGMLSGRTAEVRFYGQRQDWVQEQIDACGLAELVRQLGRVPQADAFERQRESHLLLNFKCEPGTGEGILSSKVYEYLAARRPILSVGAGDDVADELIDRTGAGLVVRDLDTLIAALRDSYREYLASGTVRWRGDAALVSKYSQRQMAGQFARLLTSSASSPEDHS